MVKYRMLDLFCGLKGASQPMIEDSKWEVITVDIDEKFEPDICADVLNLKPDDLMDNYDLIWASPPCDRFSIACAGHYWKNSYIPKTEDTVDRVNLVYHTLYLINQLNPDYWFIENPRGMLRNLIGKPEGLVTYCQYGENRMKPTDLWGKHPDSFTYKSCSNGDNCHESVPRGPRGSKKGTQGQNTSEERAKVPYGLSKAIKKSVENPNIPNLDTFLEGGLKK